MAKVKVEYIGDRSAVLFGKHILHGEVREIDERFAEKLALNPNFRILDGVTKVEKTLPVEEIFTDPSVEALEAALTPVEPANDEQNLQKAEDADESQGAEQVEYSDANETVDADEDADPIEDDEETDDAE